MIQEKALDGSKIQTKVISTTLDDALYEVVGTKFGYAPDTLNGLVGVDIESGLVEVQLTPEKKTKMKFGKYLVSRGFDDKIVRDGSSKLKASVEMIKGAALSFTTNGEEAMEVYEEGPHSCMSHCSAVQVYDGVDICVAYVKVGGRILARALATTNPEDKMHSRIYGNKDMMQPLLEKAGYSCDGSWEDLTVARIEHGSTYWAPYSDEGMGYEHDGDRLILSHCGEGGASTDGLLGRVCDNCREAMCDDDRYWSEYHEQDMCESCYDEQHVYIESMSNSYAIDDDDIVEIRCEYYHTDDLCWSEAEQEWLLEDDAIYSEISGDYHSEDNLTMAIVNVDTLEEELVPTEECQQIDDRERVSQWVWDEIAEEYEKSVSDQLELELGDD